MSTTSLSKSTTLSSLTSMEAAAYVADLLRRINPSLSITITSLELFGDCFASSVISESSGRATQRCWSRQQLMLLIPLLFALLDEKWSLQEDLRRSGSLERGQEIDAR